jgi:L-fuculose-phosphate aldolase
MHLAIYRARPKIGAIVHTHPPYATAFATAGVELPWEAVPELIVFVGPVALCSYATPGTEAVPQSLEPYWADHDAFLLSNHGLLTIGASLEEAERRLEIVEHAARILHLSHQLGGANKLPPDELERLTKYRLELRKNL